TNVRVMCYYYAWLCVKLGKIRLSVNERWKYTMAKLASAAREGKGKRSELTELRSTGKIPAIVYGYEVENTNVPVDENEFITVINMKSEVTVDVTIEVVGEAAGVKEGGVVEQPAFQVQVTATPDNIPESIEINVEALEIGDSIHVSDLREGGNYTIENEDEETLVSIVPPQKEEDLEETEGEEVEGSEEGEEAVSEETEDEEQ